MSKHTLYWVARFLSDKNFGHMRFKRLNVGYPMFDFDDELIDTVELDKFIKVEKNRLPLFIGSQFGIHPKMVNIPGFASEDRIIAVLAKSLLSGCVAGLSIYRVVKGDIDISGAQSRKIIMFRNLQMTQFELKIQKQLVSVFERLKEEISRLESEVSQHGWIHRNAVISFRYSYFTEDEKLNKVRAKLDKITEKKDVHKWLYDLMVKHRDLFGCFKDYAEMLAEIDSIISACTIKEQYEIVAILVKWRKELPNPIKTMQ